MTAPDADAAGRRTRVVVAEDHLLVAEAIATMLSFEDDLEVAATTRSGTDVVRLATELQPDIVLMDVGLEGLNGVEATRRIAEADPTISVIMLTMHDDVDTVARCVAAGASGFLPKNTSRADLLAAVWSVAAGEAFLHPSVTAGFLQRMAPLADQSLEGERLTEREREVLEELAQGKTTRQIADALIIGEETVKTHLGRIYQKLAVTDRLQAVAVAIRRGLVP